MSGEALDVLLVEPYFSGSHRAWAEGYRSHSTHRVHLVTHEGSFWRWRLRGAALTLAQAVDESVAARGRPDVVVVSDMVNLAAFLGLTRRSLAGIPVALYLHENQLLYPPPPRRGRDPNRRAPSDPEEAALVNWVSLAAADAVYVNSAFHLTALVDALPALLARAPDHSHAAALAQVEARLSVLPVGVEMRGLAPADRPGDGAAPRIVWNQRWEHDKDPVTFLRALEVLAAEGVAFDVVLAGENVRVDPQEFDRARRVLGERVVHVGYLPDDEYRQVLRRSDVVVSTAQHEFFGISMVEAMAAGVVPLLPDRLSYPELVPERFHENVLYRDGELVERLRDVLVDIEGARSTVAGLSDAMSAYAWEAVGPRYDESLSELVAEYGPGP